MGIFDLLLAFDHLLYDWLLRASPTTEGERADMQRILALRGDLDDAINDLVADRLKLPLSTLPTEVASLQSATATLQASEKTIATLQTVLTAAGTVVEVAGKVVAFAAGI